DQIDKVRGMDIIVTTSAKTDEEARELLRLFGFPFTATAEAKQAASINKNERRKALVKKYAAKYAKLKAVADDESADETERLIARLKLAEIPRNGNPTRVRNRCATTGRPRGYYRKFGLCRVELRDLANKGMIPGVTKSSW
ncbi:hypothetical protein E4T56_gene20703, partial [Termitomyces sp. T112]